MPDARPDISNPSPVHEISRITRSIPVADMTPMRHAIWLRACAEAINPNDAFEIIVAGDRESPRAAALFRRKTGLIFQRLALLGGEDIPLHTDVFYENQQAACALADKIVDRKLPARFGYFTAQSVFIDALKEAAKGRAFIVSSAFDSAPYLRLDETFLLPEQKFTKHRQANLRRRRRKLETRGAVEMKIVSPQPDDVNALLDEFIKLEASGWKGRAESALAHEKNTQAFFRRYGRLASEAGIFRFSMLRVDGRLVAARIGVECDGSFWGFKSGYDENFKDCSPGTILFIEVLKYAAQQGLATYEFLGALEPWIRDWTSDTHPKVRLRYYPYNAAGAVALCADGSAALTHRVRKRISEFQKKTLGSRR